MNYDTSLYANKIIMAPMVRAGRTPLRIQALEYGADLCYTEEIIDQKLLSCSRVDNTVLGTVDYSQMDDVILRVAKGPETGRCVLQIGTNDPSNAAQVASLIGSDVAAIDVNMGCPKAFSVHNGRGAALLTQADAVRQILTSLKAVAKVPISCKIRVLEDPALTLNLVREIEKCGVSAIGVHGRRRNERQLDAVRIDEIREIARAVSIPVIANGGSGEMESREDILKFRDDCGASSVMVARAALQRPSIFREAGALSMEQNIADFLEKVCEYDENYTMTKYVVQRMLGGEQEHNPRGKATVLAGSVAEICKAWDLTYRYEHWRQIRARMSCKRKRTEFDVDDDGAKCIDVTFPMKKLRERENRHITPKTVLHEYCQMSSMDKPVYTWTKRDIDKRFEGMVEVNGIKYRSRKGQANIKMAEQVAALAALIGMGCRDKLDGDWEEN